MVPAAGAALIRLAAYPEGLALPELPDLARGDAEQWLEWLTAVWALPPFAAAVTEAAPTLAGQVARALAGQPLPARRVRRLSAASLRYLLRWTTRATPFGTFAGVAPAAFGARASVRIGQMHRAVLRPDGQAIADRAVQAERDLGRLRRVAVVTNQLGYRQGDHWVLPCARTNGDRRWHIQVRLSPLLRDAIDAARLPVGFADLAAKIAGAAGLAAAEDLLAGLVQAGVLCSALRPAMTATDAVGHRPCPDPAPGRAGQYAAAPECVGRMAVDLRADATVTLPPAVAEEAGRAAAALVAVAPPVPPGWVEYHDAFIARWGPGAAVPVREVLAVLGYPAGYRGSARHVVVPFTARDRLLNQLAQQAALDDCAEVVLDDALAAALRGDDHRAPVPHTELRFTLAADTTRDLDRGAFTLTVLSGSRHAGVAAGRFLHLLSPAELASFRQVYQHLPTVLPGADTVQLSGPPLDAGLVAVARAPRLLPLLALGEYQPAPGATVEDLAVAGDGTRLWLTSRTTGRPVEALLFNSVLPGLQQPLIRFLTEISIAWNAPCARFDWGSAASLPFLPRVRRGRSVLHPARWNIDRAKLPGRRASWPAWRDAWRRHRDRYHLPPHVLTGGDDVRLRLDLDEPAHLAVLRDEVGRHPRTVITEAPGPAGWIGGRPAEVLLTLTHPAATARRARPARPASTTWHPPALGSPWLEARLYGHLDGILANLATRPGLLPPGWWFLRYPSPEPHLRVRVPTSDTGWFTDTAGDLADWVRCLYDAGLAHDHSLHAYRPETRHGTGATLAAAHAVFAADSRAALDRLGGDRQATAAAGMAAIAAAFTGDGACWLATHIPHRGGPRLDHAQLARARARPDDQGLAAALAVYRALAESDGLELDQILADLLHLHHARVIGVDTASELHCLRLARTVARGTSSIRGGHAARDGTVP